MVQLARMNNRVIITAMNLKNVTVMAIWAIVLGVALRVEGKADIRPESLKCEYRTNPLGIDVAKPRLSWILDSTDRGQFQTAYQILAATAEDKLSKTKADLWDSGKVMSSDSVAVVYNGQALHSGKKVFW